LQTATKDCSFVKAQDCWWRKWSGTRGKKQCKSQDQK